MIFGTRERALEMMKGNEQAVDFIERVAAIAHFWDDMIDRDKPVADSDIHARMTDALIHLPRNTFYAANFQALNACLATSIANWRAANRMENEGGDHNLHIAFIVRSSYADIVTLCAAIVGGVEWAATVAYEARMEAHGEGYPGYLNNLAAQKAAQLE